MNTAINLVERRSRDLTRTADRIEEDHSAERNYSQVADLQAGPERLLLDGEATTLRRAAMAALTPMAIVEIIGDTLAECAQHYFRQSEQLQAGLKLAVARAGEDQAWRAGGLMLQRVPPEGGLAPIGDDVEDAWRRVMVLMSSTTPDELVAPDLPPRRLLWRLFHEEGVRVFDTHAVEARCRCSRERIARILLSFPADDIEDMQKDPVTTVTCEFCNTRYDFPAAELERLAQA